MHKILLVLLVIAALGSALPTQAAGAGRRAKVQSQPLPPQQVMPQQAAAQQAATPEAPQAPMVHYQAPPTLPNGNPNLIHYWYEYGGARLYWQGLIDPQQVKLLGPAWRDPAQHAQLTDTGYGASRQVRRKGRARKAVPAKKPVCPNGACANNAACTCGAAQSQGAAQPQGKTPDNAAKPSAPVPKADVGASVKRTYQPGQLGPGPKPTTYTEVSPKAAANVGQSAVSGASPALPVPAPMPALTPTPLVPAAQPAAAAIQTSGNSTGRISQQ